MRLLLSALTLVLLAACGQQGPLRPAENSAEPTTDPAVEETVVQEPTT